MWTTTPVLAVGLALLACGESPPRLLLGASRSDVSPVLRAACELTEHKCSRCHTIDRVLSFPARTRAEWEPIVMRMRRIVSSGITRTDADAVLLCLGNGR